MGGNGHKHREIVAYKSRYVEIKYLLMKTMKKQRRKTIKIKSVCSKQVFRQAR